MRTDSCDHALLLALCFEQDFFILLVYIKVKLTHLEAVTRVIRETSSGQHCSYNDDSVLWKSLSIFFFQNDFSYIIFSVFSGCSLGRNSRDCIRTHFILLDSKLCHVWYWSLLLCSYRDEIILLFFIFLFETMLGYMPYGYVFLNVTIGIFSERSASTAQTLRQMSDVGNHYN